MQIVSRKSLTWSKLASHGSEFLDEYGKILMGVDQDLLTLWYKEMSSFRRCPDAVINTK